MLVANSAKLGEELGRGNNEAAFAEYRLDDNSGDTFFGDVATEKLGECLRAAMNLAVWVRFAVRAAVAVGVRNAIDLAGERFEASLIGMRLAGERKAEQRASVKCIFKADDSRTLGVSARNLDCVLDGFRTGVQEKRLLGKLTGRDAVHGLGKRDIVLVRSNLGAGMEKAVHLPVNRRGDGGMPMSHIHAADAAGEIDQDVAVDIFDERAVGPRHVNRCCMREAARNGLFAASLKHLGTWSRDCRT